ncbi:2835_t:CDS:2, partial [Scutellospora calospora]
MVFNPLLLDFTNRKEYENQNKYLKIIGEKTRLKEENKKDRI